MGHKRRVGHLPTAGQGLRLRLIPRENGNVAAETRIEAKDVAAELAAMGIASGQIADALLRLNVGQSVELTVPAARPSAAVP